jgi:acyl-homoserine lactone synthase
LIDPNVSNYSKFGSVGVIHIVNAHNRDVYTDALDEHFQIRHEIYVGERKWMRLQRPDGRERDQFDNEDAVYLLAIDNEKIIGGSRLIPSLKPHLLSEVFPNLALKGVPRASGIYEWTRVHVIKERREGRNRGIALGSVFCGVLEYCLAEGITGLSALVEMWWLPHFHEMGWTVWPLGIPELIEGEWSVAILLEVNQETLDNTRAVFGITGSVIVDPASRVEPQVLVQT